MRKQNITVTAKYTCEETTQYYTVSLKGETCCESYRVGLQVPEYSRATLTSGSNSSTFSVPAGENISIKTIYSQNDVGLGINYITEWRNGEMYKSHDGSSISNYTMPAADVKFTMMPDCSKACSGSGGSGSDYEFYVSARLSRSSDHKTSTLEMSCGDGTPSNYSGIKSVYACINTNCGTGLACATVECSTSQRQVWDYVTTYNNPVSCSFHGRMHVSCNTAGLENAGDGDIITCNGKKLKLIVSP